MAATIAHALMVVPAWRFLGRLPGAPGRGLFLSLLVLAAVTGIMRLHVLPNGNKILYIPEKEPIAEKEWNQRLRVVLLAEKM